LLANGRGCEALLVSCQALFRPTSAFEKSGALCKNRRRRASDISKSELVLDKAAFIRIRHLTSDKGSAGQRKGCGYVYGAARLGAGWMQPEPIEDILARRFRIDRPATLVAKTVSTNPIIFSRLRSTEAMRGRSMSVPPVDAFTFQVPLTLPFFRDFG
jgi:hypothetical protein